MKRLIMPFGALFLLVLSPSAFANWEAGVTLFPTSSSSVAAQPSGALDWMVGLHLGYTFRRHGYASWDAISLPDYLTQRFSAGAYQVPSFLNLWDVGLRAGRNVYGFAQVGLNNLLIYDVGLAPLAHTGANIRAGIGAKLQIWEIDLSATEVYPSFSALAGSVSGVVADGTSGAAFKTLVDGLVWSVGLNLTFP